MRRAEACGAERDGERGRDGGRSAACVAHPAARKPGGCNPRAFGALRAISLFGAIGVCGLRPALAQNAAQADAPAQVAVQPVPEIVRVLPPGTRPDDARLAPPRKYGDKYHPWSPPTTKAAWEREAAAIRERVLVATGLWPLPPKAPLQPEVHGRLDRGDYTVEKVRFASHPGHYVTGNLYRPKNGAARRPGVLCPHGHWPSGRFFEAKENAIAKELENGAEKFAAGAKSPLQARMIQLARMGCTVFHYDMVGYADSTLLPHRSGFGDAEASLRLQNPLGLQTWNSIRALDFLLTLPEVDPARIGVTGSSGGGTQTFMLCAVDSRPVVAFPAVMVSADMQGGCVCENCDYLRIGINNIALAALTAPRPMAMAAAKDWTIDIETKGLPELKQIWALYDRPDLVAAKVFPQFGHNYNGVSRQVMYEWFDRHLGLGTPPPIAEKDFEYLPPSELSVFDASHPQPTDGRNVEALRKYLAETADRQFADLLAETAKQGPDAYRNVVGTAARVMLDAAVSGADAVDVRVAEGAPQKTAAGLSVVKGTLGRQGERQQIPFVILEPAKKSGLLVVWIDGDGKQHLVGGKGIRPEVQALLDAGAVVASADAFLTGEFVEPGRTPAYPAVDANYPGYTFCYNRPTISQRVRDVVAATTALAARPGVERVRLVGTGTAGPWVLLARTALEGRVERTLVDLDGFAFDQLGSAGDPNFLPGALKYGGIGGLGALAAPGPLVVHRPPKTEWEPLTKVFAAAKGKLDVRPEAAVRETLAKAILE